jgi:shikimate kinase
MKGVVLIGFMGTGKTAVGKRLAERLQMNFRDIDALIEEKLGSSIELIFRKYGEPYFRKIEREMVAHISSRQSLVVATGGGVVLNPENVVNLKKIGRIIHLSARPDVILGRIKDEHHRPLLESQDREGQVEVLQAKRASFYAVADLEIDTSDLSIEDVVERILSYLRES